MPCVSRRMKLPCLARMFTRLAALDTKLWRTVVVDMSKAPFSYGGDPAGHWVSARADQLEAAHLIGFLVRPE